MSNPNQPAPTPVLCNGLNIEYKAFARSFSQSKVGVLFLIATCEFRMSGMTIFFEQQSGYFQLMQQPPSGHFTHLVTYYFADWPKSGVSGETEVPNQVTILDGHGRHVIDVHPW